MSAEYTNLAEALSEAQAAGLHLDVSRLQANGLGGVAVAPGDSVAGYPVVSNNYASYKLAMDILSQSGVDYGGMSDAYLEKFGNGRQSPSPRRSPSPRVPSPRAASPVVQLPQVSPPVQLQRTPSPRVSPQVQRVPSPRVSPQVQRVPSPRVSPQVQRVPSPRVSPQVQRVPSPRVSPQVQRVPSPPRVVTTTVVAAKSPKQAKPAMTPQERLAVAYNKAQAEGKLLDVSNLDNEGFGYKSSKPPKTGRGTKKGINPVIVISDNYNGYALAMALLGEGFKQYADQYYQTYGGGKILPQTQQKKGTGSRKRYGDIVVDVPVPDKYVDITAVVIKPQGARSPRAASPRAASPRAASPRAKSPKAKSPKAKSPKAKSPKTKSPKAKSPKAKSPKAKSPKAKSPKAKSPKPINGGLLDTSGSPVRQVSPARVTIARPPSPGRLSPPPRAVLIPQ